MNISPKLRVLVVAKPWTGGLGLYVHRALAELLGEDRATLIPTRPQTLRESLARAANRHAWEQALRRRIETTPYDVAIFVQPPTFLAQLPTAQKHILWMVDDARGAADWAGAMGHIFHSDPAYAEEVKAQIPAQHFAGVLPFAMLPMLHHPAATSPAAQSPMCFIANRDSKRTEWLTKLFTAGLECHVYGNYFLQHGLHKKYPFSFCPPVTISQLQSIYARHHLSLNIHAAVVREGTNMRSFEAAGYGIPQLIEHRPGIETLFDPVREIACFTTPEDAKAQYDRLLKDKNAAQQMAQQARARVLAEHTYQHRVHTMLARV